MLSKKKQKTMTLDSIIHIFYFLKRFPEWDFCGTPWTNPEIFDRFSPRFDL